MAEVNQQNNTFQCGYLLLVYRYLFEKRGIIFNFDTSLIVLLLNIVITDFSTESLSVSKSVCGTYILDRMLYLNDAIIEIGFL